MSTRAAQKHANGLTDTEIAERAQLKKQSDADKRKAAQVVKKQAAAEKAAVKEAEKKVAADKAAADKNAANKAATDSETEMRRLAMISSSNSSYPGFSSHVLVSSGSQHQPLGESISGSSGESNIPKRRRINNTDSDASIYLVKSAELQLLMSSSTAVGDASWQDEILKTSTYIAAVVKSRMLVGDSFQVVEAIPDQGEMVDEKFFRTSHHLVFRIVEIKEGGGWLVQYIGGTAKQMDDALLIEPVGRPPLYVVRFEVTAPAILRQIKGKCNSPIFRGGVEVVMDDNEAGKRRRQNEDPSAGSGGTVPGGESQNVCMNDCMVGEEGKRRVEEEEEVEVVKKPRGKEAEYAYFLNCFQERLGTNNKEGMAQRAADCTAAVRAMSIEYRADLFGTIQTMQSDKYLVIVKGRGQRVSTYGVGGDRHTDTSSINMVLGCPVVDDPALFRAFMVGNYSLLSLQSFVKDKSSLQCDGYVSTDNFHAFAGVVYILEVCTVSCMGKHWDKATWDFRNEISSIGFPHRKVTSQAMVTLTWEAISDTWSTIASKERDEKWGLTLDRKGCVQLLKNRLAMVISELKNDERRKTIHEQLAMTAHSGEGSGHKAIVGEKPAKKERARVAAWCQWAFGEMVGARKDGALVSCRLEDCNQKHLSSLGEVSELEAVAKASEFKPVGYKNSVMNGIKDRTNSFRRAEGGGGRGVRGGGGGGGGGRGRGSGGGRRQR
jgi:uncharacterized membrane protein YgcG